MFIRMYVCMHACMHACIYVCLYICTHAQLYPLWYLDARHARNRCAQGPPRPAPEATPPPPKKKSLRALADL